MVEAITDQAAANEVTADSLMTSDSSINKEMMCRKIEEMCLKSDFITFFASEGSPEIPEALPTSEIDEEMEDYHDHYIDVLATILKRTLPDEPDDEIKDLAERLEKEK